MIDRKARQRKYSMNSVAWLVIALLLGLLIVSAGTAPLSRLVVSHAVQDLERRLVPAQQAATALAKAYDDEETGQRGFLLTGDPQFLQPYNTGRADSGRLLTQLDQLVGDDPQAGAALGAIDTTASTWQSDAAPAMVQRQTGPIPAEQITPMASHGKQLFDTLRQRLADLDARTSQLTTDQLKRISTAQTAAKVTVAAVLGLAVLVAIIAVLALRRFLTRPLDRLLRQLRLVAAGDYEQPIEADGPHEISTIATAANRMRTSILHSSGELARRDEQHRFAADLHDSTIQRVFALGLALSSDAVRHPDRAADLIPFVAGPRQKTTRGEPSSVEIGSVLTAVIPLRRTRRPPIDTWNVGVATMMTESPRTLPVTA